MHIVLHPSAQDFAPLDTENTHVVYLSLLYYNYSMAYEIYVHILHRCAPPLRLLRCCYCCC